MRSAPIFGIVAICLFSVLTGYAVEHQSGQKEYAHSILAEAGLKADFILENLGHPEAFRISEANGRIQIEAGSNAGFVYGVQALAADEYTLGVMEKPDFKIRGTTLPMFKDGGYKATLSPETFPWFYDKELMTRTLDTFAEARFNTIFLWGSHLFPYIVEMPKYPEAASDVPPEQIKANQEQFLWFTTECEKRNIKVLLHFYNIHLTGAFAKHHKISRRPEIPTPLTSEYTHYALSRYFEEFPSVGLYACPGETIDTDHQLEWFRDVIFDAAKKSGKNPEIVIRDWTLNHDFRDQLKSLYDNVYSELKQNDESLTSPYPDIRHMKWEGLTAGHIINAAHGPAQDLVPMRWANPLFVQEMATHWKSLGFVSGVEFWGQSFWNWPYTYDRVSPELLYLERDAPFYAVVGRYLWQVDRDMASERDYWADYYSERFDSREVGELLARWYEVSGSIGPGLLNLNATRVANWWSSVALMQKNVDQILNYNKRLDDTPYTLYREAGRANQRYYPRPFDDYFFERYKAKYKLPVAGVTYPMFEEFYPYAERIQVEDLAQRKCMPVTQYVEYLVKGEPVVGCLTPDKAISLLYDLANEAVAIAEKAYAAAGDSPHQEELARFISDSMIFKLATETLMAKQDAAILKARMRLQDAISEADKAAFLEKMESSVALYQKLHDLGQAHYTQASFRITWAKGLREFKGDLNRQKKWLATLGTGPSSEEPELTKFENTIDGGFRIEAEWMSGPWSVGTEKYTDFEGAGYAAPPKANQTEPMVARIEVDAAMKCEVMVRALLGGSHQDRALAVEVDGQRLPPTHKENGPPEGAYTWEKAGVVSLPVGEVEIKLYPVGKKHPCADVIMLNPVKE